MPIQKRDKFKNTYPRKGNPKHQNGLYWYTGSKVVYVKQKISYKKQTIKSIVCQKVG